MAGEAAVVNSDVPWYQTLNSFVRRDGESGGAVS